MGGVRRPNRSKWRRHSGPARSIIMARVMLEWTSVSTSRTGRTVVPRSVRVAEAPSHGLPVTHYDRRSPGAEAYWKVAMELVERA